MQCDTFCQPDVFAFDQGVNLNISHQRGHAVIPLEPKDEVVLTEQLRESFKTRATGGKSSMFYVVFF